jgi:hypothetical protein
MKTQVLVKTLLVLNILTPVPAAFFGFAGDEAVSIIDLAYLDKGHTPRASRRIPRVLR